MNWNFATSSLFQLIKLSKISWGSCAQSAYLALATPQSGQKSLSLDKVKFNILQDLSENPGISGIDFANYTSGKINETVFHLASRILDHDLRNETLNFFKTKAGNIASQFSNLGTPILNLCRTQGFRINAAGNDYNSGSPVDEIESTKFFFKRFRTFKKLWWF